MRQIQDIRLKDVDAERVRRDHADAIKEIQALLPKVIPSVTLEDGVETHVSHGLGRAPRAVWETIVRGAITAGRIVEDRSNVDRTKSVKLTANGYGATITVDLVVMP
jgi:hypothetical protein